MTKSGFDIEEKTLTDLIADAISDSMDYDWTARDGARSTYAALVPLLTEIRELRAENARLKKALERRPWPPSEAELREMLASIVAEWWSKSTAHYIRTARNLRPEDIKGLYAVRDALAPYVARAALGEPQ